MIRLKINLKPRNGVPISLNYKYYLAAICNNAINNSKEDFDEKLMIYNTTADYKRSDLLTFTQFFCKNYEIRGNKIIFKDIISWYITSPVYELILHLVQEFFSNGTIKIAREELEITELEAVETEEISIKDLNSDIHSLFPAKDEEIFEKLAGYYLMHEEEKII